MQLRPTGVLFVALLGLYLFQVEFELFAFQDVSVRATTLSRPGGNRSQNATGSEFVFKSRFDLGLPLSFFEFFFFDLFLLRRASSASVNLAFFLCPRGRA